MEKERDETADQNWYIGANELGPVERRWQPEYDPDQRDYDERPSRPSRSRAKPNNGQTA